jgi:hypothetical protein
MSFDFWYRSMGPFTVLLIVCAILALGVFIGGLAQRRRPRRHRKGRRQAAPTRVVPSVHDTGADAPIVVVEAPREPRPAAPREWDGGQPRPNWNRRSG